MSSEQKSVEYHTDKSLGFVGGDKKPKTHTFNLGAVTEADIIVSLAGHGGTDTNGVIAVNDVPVGVWSASTVHDQVSGNFDPNGSKPSDSHSTVRVHVGPRILKNGSNTISFTYTSGDHGAMIWGFSVKAAPHTVHTCNTIHFCGGDKKPHDVKFTLDHASEGEVLLYGVGHGGKDTTGDVSVNGKSIGHWTPSSVKHSVDNNHPHKECAPPHGLTSSCPVSLTIPKDYLVKGENTVRLVYTNGDHAFMVFRTQVKAW